MLQFFAKKFKALKSKAHSCCPTEIFQKSPVLFRIMSQNEAFYVGGNPQGLVTGPIHIMCLLYVYTVPSIGKATKLPCLLYTCNI